MTKKRLFNLGFVLTNFLLLLFLAEKVQNPKDIRTNLPNVVSSIPTVLPASDANSEDEFLVVKVVDGDTIVLENDIKVRYIGIDTPEISGKKGCFADEAKKKNEELVLGKKVFLEKDVSETDRYGRLLRYVYTGEGENKLMVNEVLIKEGFAQIATFPPDVKYKDLFLESEKFAREKLLGLWEKCQD